MDGESAQAPAEEAGHAEPSAPQVEDTRDSEAPSQEDTASEEQQEKVDYEKRYNDLRPEYDRNQAALKEAQQYRAVVEALQSDDPQERAWAADILGLEFDGEDESDTPDDEEGQLRDPRVDDLINEREQERQERLMDQLEDQIVTGIEDLNKKHSTDLNEDEMGWLVDRVAMLGPGEDGKPQTEKVFQEFTGILDSRIKRYRESKRDAPSAPAPGSSGANAPDLSDEKARRRLAEQVAQRAAMRSQ